MWNEFLPISMPIAAVPALSFSGMFLTCRDGDGPFASRIGPWPASRSSPPRAEPNLGSNPCVSPPYARVGRQALAGHASMALCGPLALSPVPIIDDARQLAREPIRGRDR